MVRLSVALVLVAACYRPQAVPDVPCSPSGACPTGQMCVASLCVLDGTLLPVDAPIDTVGDASVDASVDARADAAAPDAMPDAAMPDAAKPDAAIMLDAAIDAAPPPVIMWRATTTSTVPQTGAGFVTVTRPSCAIGDVMVATVAMGNTGQPMMPMFIAPTGWTLVRRLDRGNDSTLLVYWHAMSTLEPPSYSWAFSAQIEGVAWISCYANVDASAPIEAESGDLDPSAGPSYPTPSITTTTANAMLVASFASHNAAGPANAWSPPTGTNVRANLSNGTTRSGLGVDALMAAAGPSGALSATVSVPEDYALVELVALAPAP